MTKDELITLLQLGSGDPEVDHGAAEDLLLLYIDDPDIKEAWDTACITQGWWYA